MAPPRGPCVFCTRQVEAHQKAAYPVRGWEIERSAGGANRIFGRKREPDRIAHAACVEQALRKQGQGGLF